MATFYFDGHSGISDPDAAWTNDANAFDGSFSTTASAPGSSGASTSSKYLLGQGTTAPDYSSNSIINVYFRLYTGNTGVDGHDYGGTVYTEGQAETLGSATKSGVSIQVGYTGYTLLTAPTGGWTWAGIRELEVKIYANDAGLSFPEVYRAEIEVTTESVGEVVYFDGSDAAATDPDAAWTNETNLDDGSITTFADCSVNGTESTNFAKIAGTNAPSTGFNIIQVKARINAYSNSSSSGLSIEGKVYTNGLAELLGTASADASSTPGTWSSYAVLSTPSGGWTWAKVQTLEVKVIASGGGDSGAHASKVELQIFTDPPAKGIYRIQGFQ